MKKIILSGFLVLIGIFLFSTSVKAQGTFECLCIRDQTGNCGSFQAISVKCDPGYQPSTSTCQLDAQIRPCVASSSVTNVPWGGSCDPNNPNQVCSNRDTTCRRDSSNSYRCLYSGNSKSLNDTCQDTTECNGYSNVGFLTRCGAPPGGGPAVCKSQQQGQLCRDTSGASCKASCSGTEHNVSATDCLGSAPICCAPNPSTSSSEVTCQGGNGINTAIGCVPINDSNALVGFILRWGVGIGGGIAFLLILIAGFQIMTSRGDPKRLQAGQELLTSAIAGILMLIFSVIILRVIGVDILGVLK